MSLDALLLAARTGDPGDRKRLAKGLVDKLEAYFRPRCPRGDARDLLQDTLVEIAKHLDTFVPTRPGAFEHFVLTVARNKLFAHRRAWARERLRRVDTLPLCMLADRSFTARLARRELIVRIEEAMGGLTDVERRAIEALIDEEDWQVLVEQEAVSRGTLRVRRHRAIARLRQILRRADPTLVPESS